ncbi:MAG: VOC family protein [Piscirickettsiaceae bacterium]|nr:VOC family protein [Piscirickettsiaceae bacterium]
MHLDHTIVPAKDSVTTAAFYADILGLTNLGHYEHFDAVLIDDHLKLLFNQKQEFESRHYAFIVTEQEYDQIFTRIKKNPTITFGDSPADRANKQVYISDGRQGFYFDDENGHILEVIKLIQ